MKRARGVIVSIIVTIMICSLSYSEEVFGASKKQISIASGQPGALLYIMGSGVANVINREHPTLNAIVEQTGGARENFNLLANKEVEIAFGPDNFGLEKYDGKSYLYGWATVNVDNELVVLKGSKFNSIKDLKGKKISLGPAGSASNVIISTLLKGYGIGEKDFEAQFLDWEKSSDGLLDNLLDAASYMGTWPISSLQALAMRKPMRILEVDPVIIKNSFSAVYHPVVIPSNAYPGMDKDVSTVGLYAGAWFRGDLEEAVVYNIIKSLFANIEYLSTVHHSCKQFHILSRKEAEELGVKVHPGALKYAQEKGLW